LHDSTTGATVNLGNAEALMKARLGLPYGATDGVSISAAGRYICYTMHWDTVHPFSSAGIPAPGWHYDAAWSIHVYDRRTRRTTTPLIACNLTPKALAQRRANAEARQRE